MDRYKGLSRDQLEKVTDLLLNMCLHFTGAQYTESVLRARGLGDKELASMGFDVTPDTDGEWADMDACAEV